MPASLCRQNGSVDLFMTSRIDLPPRLNRTWRAEIVNWIEIRGTTNRLDTLAAVEAGADAVGFVFAPGPKPKLRFPVAER
ncbi:MAG: hypothetical protein LAO06_13540 [Acidobacteriia bacterium]|nr:hypothetical protein [Terriglobia bacterium]